jgi:hypothetical protein
LLGLAAPYLWVTAQYFWAIHINESLVRLVWGTLGVKGPGVGLVLKGIETVALAVLFGLVLRLLAGVAWRIPVATFSIAFALSFLVEAALFGSLDHAAYFAPQLVALLVCTSFAYAVLSRRLWIDA